MTAIVSAFDPPRFEPSLRYPDPAVVILDPAFARIRLFAASVERLATGFRFMEGPVWFGDGRYLLVSDVPNNRTIRWDEVTQTASVFRQPSNHAAGHTRDLQGRLVAAEGAARRISRTEHDGRVVTVADRFDGKRLNSPNDIVCQSNGAVWFSDPPFQIINAYEGRIAEPELPHAVYRIDPASGALRQVLDDLAGPNGLCFSPDEKTLYIVESRAQPSRGVRRGSGRSTRRQAPAPRCRRPRCVRRRQVRHRRQSLGRLGKRRSARRRCRGARRRDGVRP